jgi:hypothetical protein
VELHNLAEDVLKDLVVIMENVKLFHVEDHVEQMNNVLIINVIVLKDLKE